MADSARTYRLRIAVTPSPEGSFFETHGEAIVACWIVGRSGETAKSTAIKTLKSEQWLIANIRGSKEVVRADCSNDEAGFFDQAQIDGEVYVYHLSPRYSVYRVTAAVSRSTPQGSESAEASYFLSAGSIVTNDSSPYDANFWSGRSELAIASARRMIVREGWSIIGILLSGAMDSTAIPEELEAYHNLAEEEGEALALFTAAPTLN